MTPEEEENLRKLYASLNGAEAAAELPSRVLEAVVHYYYVSDIPLCFDLIGVDSDEISERNADIFGVIDVLRHAFGGEFVGLEYVR